MSSPWPLRPFRRGPATGWLQVHSHTPASGSGGWRCGILWLFGSSVWSQVENKHQISLVQEVAGATPKRRLPGGNPDPAQALGDPGGLEEAGPNSALPTRLASEGPVLHGTPHQDRTRQAMGLHPAGSLGSLSWPGLPRRSHLHPPLLPSLRRRQEHHCLLFYGEERARPVPSCVSCLPGESAWPPGVPAPTSSASKGLPQLEHALPVPLPSVPPPLPSPSGIPRARGAWGTQVAGQPRCCQWRRSCTGPPGCPNPGWALGT